MTLKIVDVSSAQGKYRVGSTGENGVMVKATEALKYVNPFCDYVIQQAIKQKKVHGVYHFASYDDPVKQARYFVANTRNYFKLHRCVGCLDYEISHPMGAKKFIKAFCNEFHRLTGGICWVYTNSGNVSALKGLDLPLWLAYYPYATTAASPATWKAPIKKLPQLGYVVTMWQFTTSHDVLDRSIFFGDSKTWNKLATKLK